VTIQGVRWLSVPPGSGFGNASAAYMAGLRRAGIPVSWSPLTWPSTPWRSPFGRAGPDDPLDLSTAEHADLVDREIGHDTVVMHSSPFWHAALRAEADDRRLVAYTAWETDRLPEPLTERLARYDLVVVPSLFNVEVLTRSGLPVPVVAVPHAADRRLLTMAKRPRDDPTFVFYTVATWTTRKAIADIVSAFANAFSASDPVMLVIHSNSRDLTEGARVDRGDRDRTPHADASWRSLAQTLANRRHAPRIHLDVRKRTTAEIASVHEQGDCFVGLSRGEGWGLGAFEAGAVGNPVVVTGWGGWLDFLPPGYPFCAEFDLVPTILDPPDRWWSPVVGERWARVRLEHAASLMRTVFDHRDTARLWGQRLRDHIGSHFSSASVTQQLVDTLGACRPGSAPGVARATRTDGKPVDRYAPDRP
jgi:glycosyltransferase involved in cell wall biosynthesis